MTDDLTMIPAAQLVAAYRQGEITPVTATEAALDAIGRYDGDVNAYCLVDPDRAMRAAEESARRYAAGGPLGPADGIPTSIKDIFLTAGWPTRRGSTLIPETGDWSEDAPAVARLREAGAVLLGKTTTPEFAWKGVTDSKLCGATGNPWDPRCHAGGSSGGAAAAVGLGMGTWAIGTDGGGSVRIPAAFTGTVALKPTYGLIPMYPSSPFGTLAHAGPMTRTVRDTAELLDVIAAFDSRDWSAMPVPTQSFAAGLDESVAGLRCAVSMDLGGLGENDPEVDARVRAAVDALAAAGVEITEVDLGELPSPTQAFHVLWFTGAAKVLESYGERALDAVDPLLASSIRTYGLDASASDYLDAMAVRMAWGKAMGRLHESYDALLTPTMPIPAFDLQRQAPQGWPSDLWTSWTPYTYPFNMTQQPALSVPCGFTEAGLPVGLQIVGARHADATVLRLGHAYQSATDWHLRRPPVLTTGTADIAEEN